MPPLKIAIIGCGAVVELAHLPALALVPGLAVTVLADKNLERARHLAQKFNVPKAVGDYRAALAEVDAAIVALPHFLHAPVTLELLQAGKHVLIEKPMALNTRECAEMIAAQSRGAVLSIGLMRRFLDAHRLARSILRQGLIGPLQSFDLREGGVYNWDVASDFFFRKESAGGGVLVDTGAHTLDSLIYWAGPVELRRYRDDAVGGVEADCELQLQLPSGAPGVVELSRTRQLRNTAIFTGEHGRLEVGLSSNELKLSFHDTGLGLQGAAFDSSRPPVENCYLDSILCQLRHWLLAMQKLPNQIATPVEAARSVALIEQCYLHRQPWEFPWTPYE